MLILKYNTCPNCCTKYSIYEKRHIAKLLRFVKLDRLVTNESLLIHIFEFAVDSFAIPDILELIGQWIKVT